MCVCVCVCVYIYKDKLINTILSWASQIILKSHVSLLALPYGYESWTTKKAEH